MSEVVQQLYQKLDNPRVSIATKQLAVEYLKSLKPGSAPEWFCLQRMYEQAIRLLNHHQQRLLSITEPVGKDC